MLQGENPIATSRRRRAKRARAPQVAILVALIGMTTSAGSDAVWADEAHIPLPAATAVADRYGWDDPRTDSPAYPPAFHVAPAAEPWTLQVMPEGLIYQSYLAGVREPRFASRWSTDRHLGQVWDATLGGRLGLLRYGTEGAVRPEGWQVDIEGAVLTRLDPIAYSTPLLSADFRVGLPITWAREQWQLKTGYYHVSAHLGDEYMELNPDAPRINYVRDAIVLGVGYFWTERLRLYGETAAALGTDGGAKPWEFQFGADWAPAHDTGLRGAPFAAINGHVREEVDFGGNLVIQAGWAWRRAPGGSLFRIGAEYFNGMSEQYQYYDRFEHRIGGGLWADF